MIRWCMGAKGEGQAVCHNDAWPMVLTLEAELYLGMQAVHETSVGL